MSLGFDRASTREDALCRFERGCRLGEAHVLKERANMRRRTKASGFITAKRAESLAVEDAIRFERDFVLNPLPKPDACGACGAVVFAGRSTRIEVHECFSHGLPNGPLAFHHRTIAPKGPGVS